MRDWRGAPEGAAESPKGPARERKSQPRLALGAAWALASALAWGCAPAAAARAPEARAPQLSATDERSWAALASPQARQALERVERSGDNAGRPFAIVDKPRARIHLFDAKGRPRGSSPALLGQQPGDHSTPGVGARPVFQVKLDERTTPAGRFAAEPGVNASGERIVWLDYDEALAIHRARPGKTFRRRMSLLTRNDPRASKDSWGCVVVPPSFYDARVAPLLGRSPSVVYVLPEIRELDAAFSLPRPRDAAGRRAS